MRHWLVLALVLLAGCENLVGPFRRPPTRVDDPRLSIAEQEKVGRDNLAFPDQAPLAGPNAGNVRPGR
jgi:hypothetical protein